MKPNNETRPLWAFPWGFNEGFFIAAGLFFIGIFLEFVVPFSTLSKPQYPVNLWILFSYMLMLIVWFFVARKNSLFQWFASIKAAIPAIALFTILILLMGLIPQFSPHIETSTCFNNILNSWMFLLTILLLLTTLGTAILNRLAPLNLRNLTFTLNHLGLWIVVAAGYFGATDKLEATLQVNLGELVWYSKDSKGEINELPIAIELKKFNAQFHPPQIAISGEKTFKSLNNYDLTTLPIITIDNINIKVEQFLSKAVPMDTGYIDARGIPYAGSAVKVSVHNNQDNKIAHGWLAYPSKISIEKAIPLPDGRTLRLLSPEPAHFSSEIKLYSKKSETVKSGFIEVNAPMKIDGWWIYQYSYDNLAGADSPYSVFKAVYDPWLSVVYTGFILMLIGVILMIVVNPEKNKQ